MNEAKSVFGKVSTRSRSLFKCIRDNAVVFDKTVLDPFRKRLTRAKLIWEIRRNWRVHIGLYAAVAS